MTSIEAISIREMPQEYGRHSNTQIPASQVTLMDGCEEIKPSSSERPAQGVTKKGLRYHVRSPAERRLKLGLQSPLRNRHPYQISKQNS